MKAWVALIIAVLGIGLWFYFSSPILQNQEPITQLKGQPQPVYPDTPAVPLIPEGDAR